ncbi:MAG: thioredoxin domain-containing protein [Bdellovibrionaceae bacterium]|nr:thioredoxin domain-containing protein [Pseudobdellovibrionaceae bacterium]
MKSNKLFVLIVIIAAAAVFAGLTLWQKPATTTGGATGVVIDNALLEKAHSPVKGTADAPVTIVEFLDPECEACRALNPIVNRLLEEFPGKLRIVIRYMPFHGNSKWAASALEEAREQGKYTEALNYLFETQPAWANHGQPRPELIARYLKEIGVDDSKLEREAVIAKHGWKIDADREDGVKLGVRYTPTFFINGKMIEEIGYLQLKEAIEKELARK